MTYRELLCEGETQLRSAGVPDEKTDARLLLEHAAGFDRTAFFLKSAQEAPEETVRAYRELIRKRGSRLPLQHILGVQEFMGFAFRCDGRALIPRQDTEILVEKAIGIIRRKTEKAEKEAGIRVLDLCTGSGCIGISLKLMCPQAAVVCSDLSKEALSLTAENARKLKADVEIMQSDLMEEIPGEFDLIVSNPPYIRTDVIGSLQTEVRMFDPRMALDGGEDGLFFYRKITEEAPSRLREDGYLLFEIGSEQASDVCALMREAGFSEVTAGRDLGGNDRVVLGKTQLREMRNRHV